MECERLQGIGPLGGARSCKREEARSFCGGKGEDRGGCKEEMGTSEEAGEEGGGIVRIRNSAQTAGLSPGIAAAEWFKRSRMLCRLTPVLEKILLICERTVLSVTPIMFAIFRGA
jgi:hypothetical protein